MELNPDAIILYDEPGQDGENVTVSKTLRECVEVRMKILSEYWNQKGIPPYTHEVFAVYDYIVVNWAYFQDKEEEEKFWKVFDSKISPGSGGIGRRGGLKIR